MSVAADDSEIILVTYLPRMLPAFVIDKLHLSPKAEKFLKLIPYTAMAALIFPGIITIDDNGFPAVYHPSERRLSLCAASRLLIVTPWQYHYRRADDYITVAYCKAMNCLVQALCRQKDDWWKQ